MNDHIKHAFRSHGDPLYSNFVLADLDKAPPTKFGAFLASRYNGGVVLIQHKRVPQYEKTHGLWVVPGGRVDCGESIADAALREFSEETGLSSRLDSLLVAHYLPERERVFMWFMGTVVGGDMRADADPETLIELVQVFDEDRISTEQVWSNVDRVVLAHMGFLGTSMNQLLVEAGLRESYAAQPTDAADAQGRS